MNAGVGVFLYSIIIDTKNNAENTGTMLNLQESVCSR